MFASSRILWGGKTIISIDAVGNVYPCHMLHDKEFLMGNIVNNSLKDILTKSPVFDEFAKLSVESISECSECSYKYLCSSGCRARAFYNSGSVYTKDTFCRMNKIYFNSLTESIVIAIHKSFLKNYEFIIERSENMLFY